MAWHHKSLHCRALRVTGVPPIPFFHISQFVACFPSIRFLFAEAGCPRERAAWARQSEARRDARTLRKEVVAFSRWAQQNGVPLRAAAASLSTRMPRRAGRIALRISGRLPP